MPNEASGGGGVVVEVLKLRDSPSEVFECLKRILAEASKSGVKELTFSVDVKVYGPPRGVNKVVFRAVVDEYVQGGVLREIWRFVNKYYRRASSFNKSLEYKGWESYVAREVLKLVEMGYAEVNDLQALRELVRARRKRRFWSLWAKYSNRIVVKPIPQAVRRLRSRLSKKKVYVEFRGGETLVKGLCGRRLRVRL
ncbi:MAG: hypothetical protein DRJ62_05580 [Thermoprotei archaeon]|nr:MAG: hypothetical protein DRJ62_05580 [Thermoprotei archaeon]